MCFACGLKGFWIVDSDSGRNGRLVRKATGCWRGLGWRLGGFGGSCRKSATARRPSWIRCCVRGRGSGRAHASSRRPAGAACRVTCTCISAALAHGLVHFPLPVLNPADRNHIKNATTTATAPSPKLPISNSSTDRVAAATVRHPERLATSSLGLRRRIRTLDTRRHAVDAAGAGARIDAPDPGRLLPAGEELVVVRLRDDPARAIAHKK